MPVIVSPAADDSNDNHSQQNQPSLYRGDPIVPPPPAFLYANHYDKIAAVCSWCGRHQSRRAIQWIHEQLGGDYMISHGACLPCCRRLLKKIKP